MGSADVADGDTILGSHQRDLRDDIIDQVAAKGDSMWGTGVDAMIKLTVGSNLEHLRADSGESSGVKWIAPFKIAFETSAAAAASGAVSYTGAGFKPIAAIIVAIGTDGNDNFSIGFADGDASSGSIEFHTMGGTPASSLNSSDKVIVAQDSAATDKQEAVLTTFDSDGLTLTWTKTANGEAVSFIIFYMG